MLGGVQIKLKTPAVGRISYCCVDGEGAVPKPPASGPFRRDAKDVEMPIAHHVVRAEFLAPLAPGKVTRRMIRCESRGRVEVGPEMLRGAPVRLLR